MKTDARQIIEALDASLVAGTDAAQVDSVFTDTRKPSTNGLFIALQGEGADTGAACSMDVDRVLKDVVQREVFLRCGNSPREVRTSPVAYQCGFEHQEFFQFFTLPDALQVICGWIAEALVDQPAADIGVALMH